MSGGETDVCGGGVSEVVDDDDDGGNNCVSFIPPPIVLTPATTDDDVVVVVVVVNDFSLGLTFTPLIIMSPVGGRGVATVLPSLPSFTD